MTQAILAEKVTSAGGAEKKRRVVVPRSEIFPRKGQYEVVVQMPGVTNEALNVVHDNRQLTIKGTVAELESSGFKPVYAEFSATDYEGTFKLPSDVDGEKIVGSLAQGVLTLNLPLQEANKTIKVKVN